MSENEMPVLSGIIKRRILTSLKISEKEDPEVKRFIIRQFVTEAVAERLSRYETSVNEVSK